MAAPEVDPTGFKRVPGQRVVPIGRDADGNPSEFLVGSGPALTDAELRASPVPVQLVSEPTIEIGKVDQGAPGTSPWPVVDAATDTLVGAVAETAPVSDTASSGLNGRLQRVAQRLTSLIGLLPSSLGQKTAAGSLAVVLPSDGALPLPIGAATSAKQDTLDTDLKARLAVLGQGPMTASAPVVIASDQSAVPVYSAPNPQAAAAYRSNLTAADVLAAPGALTTSVVTGGSLTNSTAYLSKVVAGNGYGRTTATAGTSRTTSSPNLTLRIAIPQVTGATFYDVYVSTDADPKWVGRITETQRASGILITAVGTTGAGGTAGAVDVQVAGTGLQSGATAAQNNAYVIPASPVVCTGFNFVDFDILASRTGDAAVLTATLAPFFLDAHDSIYYQGEPITLVYGGPTGSYNALSQRLRIEARGAAAVALVVQNIAGTGASLTINALVS